MLGAVVLSPESLEPIINEMASKYNIEPAWIKAHIKAESDWDVNASRFEAHKGDASWGLMQLLLATARGVLGDNNLTTTQLINPRVNIEAGTKFLSQLWNRYGNMRDAMAAYNAGSPRLNPKTGKYVNASYVYKVTKNYNRYKALGTTAGNIAINVEETITSPDTVPIYMLLGIAAVGTLIIGGSKSTNE
jgi:soluble lytic murein transglycosylase-like protein